MPRTATGCVLFTCSTCIYIVNSPFTSREDMFENLGETIVLALQMFTSGCLPWLKGVACLKLPIVTEQSTCVVRQEWVPANLLYRDGSGSDWKKTFSVLQQLEVMTNVTSLKSNQINSFTVKAHVLNVRAFLIELQFKSVGFWLSQIEWVFL